MYHILKEYLCSKMTEVKNSQPQEQPQVQQPQGVPQVLKPSSPVQLTPVKEGTDEAATTNTFETVVVDVLPDESQQHDRQDEWSQHDWQDEWSQHDWQDKWSQHDWHWWNARKQAWSWSQYENARKPQDDWYQRVQRPEQSNDEPEMTFNAVNVPPIFSVPTEDLPTRGPLEPHYKNEVYNEAVGYIKSWVKAIDKVRRADQQALEQELKKHCDTINACSNAIDEVQKACKHLLKENKAAKNRAKEQAEEQAFMKKKIEKQEELINALIKKTTKQEKLIDKLFLEKMDAIELMAKTPQQPNNVGILREPPQHMSYSTTSESMMDQ